MDSPFSQEKLKEIFKKSPAYPDRVNSRENHTLEFKKSFGWKSLSQYFKTCAAFANNKGGYIVFGIQNKPHILLGLQGNSFSLFSELDPERITRSFNECFSPEIEWSQHIHNFEEKQFGIFYIYESKNKPVMCRKSADELKEGDIYYRYRGRSETIKYSELKNILEESRRQEQMLWMRHLKVIAQAGVRSVGIFDLDSGKVTGAGGSILIDESLLRKISFIKEGEFSEIEGKPTLKLIGEVESVTSSIITNSNRPKAIKEEDIVSNFLRQSTVKEPKEYISKMATENSAFLPIYYYISKANITTQETKSILELNRISSVSKKIVSRIEGARTEFLYIPEHGRDLAQKKRNLMDAIISENLDIDCIQDDLKYCIQAFRGITKEDMVDKQAYILQKMNELFKKHYKTIPSGLLGELRRAICWIDEALYKNISYG